MLLVKSAPQRYRCHSARSCWGSLKICWNLFDIRVDRAMWHDRVGVRNAKSCFFRVSFVTRILNYCEVENDCCDSNQGSNNYENHLCYNNRNRQRISNSLVTRVDRSRFLENFGTMLILMYKRFSKYKKWTRAWDKCRCSFNELDKVLEAMSILP